MSDQKSYCLMSLDGALVVDKRGFVPTVADRVEQITKWSTIHGARKAKEHVTANARDETQRKLGGTAAAVEFNDHLIEKHIRVVAQRKAARHAGELYNNAILKAAHDLEVARDFAPMMVMRDDGEMIERGLPYFEKVFDDAVNDAVRAAERDLTIWPYLTAKRTR